MGPPGGWSENHPGDSANTGAKTLSVFSLGSLFFGLHYARFLFIFECPAKTKKTNLL